MNYRITKAFIAFILVLGILLPTNMVRAADPETLEVPQMTALEEEGEDASGEQCSTIQVVLMIDQSNSMHRNDPYGYRYEEPIYITDLLASNYLQARNLSSSSSLVTPVKIQFAVIQFASSATIAVDWMSISPSDDDSWQEIQERIIPSLSPNYEQKQELYKEIGNGTNFEKAFTELEALFSRADDQIGDCPKRLVLLLTDGSPDISGNSIDDADLKDHMNNVEMIANRALKGSADSLYVTGLNVSNDDYWTRTRKYWENIADNDPADSPRRVEKVNSYAEIGYRMSDIIHANMGDFTTQINPGDLVVPPYLESLSLTFYKPDTENVIELSDDKGLIDEDRTDVDVVINGTEGAIQTIIVNRPEPGIYKLATNAKSDDFMITQQMIFINAQMVEPVGAIQQFATGKIALELIDAEGNVLPKYADSQYELHVDAEAFTDAGDVWEQTLIQQDDGALTGSFVPFVPGVHHFKMTAEVMDDANVSWVIFDEASNIFDFYVSEVVLNTDAFQFNSDRDNCPLVQATSFTSTLNLVNNDSGEIALINYPVIWDIDAPDGVEVIINGPNPEGFYSVSGESQVSGSQPIQISAGVKDPDSNVVIPLGQINYTPVFEESRQYDISIEREGVEASLGNLGLSFHQLWNDIEGKTKADMVLVGRQYFFRPETITVKANLVDGATQAPIDTNGIIPPVSFVSDKDPSVIYTSEWVSLGDGEFVATFEKLPVGYYHFDFEMNNSSCTDVVTADVGIQSSEMIQVARGASEYILLSAAGLVVLALIVWLLKWTVCKIVNPVKGYGRFYAKDGNQKRGYPKISAPNTACWQDKVKNADVVNTGMKKIQIRALGQKKGQFKLIVFYADGKKEEQVIETENLNRVYRFRQSEHRFMYKDRVGDLDPSMDSLSVATNPAGGTAPKPKKTTSPAGGGIGTLGHH